MEWLLDDESRQYQKNIEPIPWLGFDHDTSQQYRVAVPLGDYPVIRGWSRSQVQSLQNRESLERATHEELSMCQSMLFFGAWEILVDQHLSTKDYIFHTPTGYLLRGFNLNSVMTSVFTSLIAHTNDVDEQNISYLESKAKRFQDLQIELWNWRNEVENSMSIARGNWATLFDILINLDVLLETIFFLRADFPKYLQSLWPKRWSGSITRDILTRNLIASGCCPAIAFRLQKLGICALGYTKILELRSERSENRHYQCDKRVCTANDVVSAEFRARHLIEDCTCSWIKVPIPEIRKVLMTDNYFILDASKLLGPNASVETALVPYQPGEAYVAVSHVWSHGLGGSADDGLPRCRLEELIRIFDDAATVRFNQLGEPLVDAGMRAQKFWIDTLCIPKDHDLKMRSITIMDKIYKNASAVLVIDANLRCLPFRSSSFEQITIQYLLSDWNLRLWTFQEAYLSKKLLILFKDGVFPLEALNNKRGESASFTTLTSCCRGEIIRMSHDYRNTLQGSHLFAISYLLTGRHSSDITDEPLVISTLLGIENRPLTQLTGEERHCELWKLLRHVPRDIVFFNSEKLSKRGFRWAPKTFLVSDTGFQIAPTVPDDAEVTEFGLRSKYPMMRLSRSYSFEHQSGGVLETVLGKLLLSPRSRKTIVDGKEFNALIFSRMPSPENMSLQAATLLREDDEQVGNIDVYRYQHRIRHILLDENSFTEYHSLGRTDVIPAEETIMIS
jgi:Heterokaryon incompatibility protein (HET)